MSIKILGTGYYVPEKIVTNDDLQNLVDTSDEWIMQRVGVAQRRVSTDETAGDFAVKASLSALENSGIKPDELDLIIAASISSETLCPTVAGYVQKHIGATCPSFDVNSACSGFIFALDTAVSFMARGTYKNILVIGAERLSKIVDWTDRSTCVIFGDGAGACVISQGEGYIASKLFTQGDDTVISIPSFGGTSPFYKRDIPAPYIFMDGQETFKFAVNKIVSDIKDITAKSNLTIDDIDHVVLHQANIRIIDFAVKRLKMPREKFIANLDKYGNTSSASVPIALAELNASGRLKRGDIVVLSAFGGGLSSGVCLIRW